MDCVDSIEGKNGVFVRVGNQQWPWGDERGNLRKVPAVGVHWIHAVTVAFHTSIHHVIAQRSDPSHGNRHFDPMIDRGDPPAVGTTTGSTRHAKTFFIHFRSRLQIIERPDTIPGLCAS